MIDFIKSWILNIIILAVLISLLEIIIPSGKMKKYINMVSGFILILAIINPFISFFKRGVNLKEFQISGSNYIDKREVEENSKILKKQQMKQTVDLYRKKIISQIEETVKEVEGVNNAEADLIINEDYTSSGFGEIKRIFIYLNMTDSVNQIKHVEKVKKVQIGKGDFEKSPGKSTENDYEDSSRIDKAVRNEIEKKVSRLLDVGSDNIIISLRENRGGLDDEKDF